MRHSAQQLYGKLVSLVFPFVQPALPSHIHSFFHSIPSISSMKTACHISGIYGSHLALSQKVFLWVKIWLQSLEQRLKVLWRHSPPPSVDLFGIHLKSDKVN